MSSNLTTCNIIAKRYAKALFDLALAKNVITQIAQDLAKIISLKNISKGAEKLLSNSMIPTEKQQELVQQIIKNASINQLTEKFLQILVKNKRLYIISFIKEEFEKLVMEQNNEIEINITSKIDLDKKQTAEIIEIIGNKLQKKIIVNKKINPQILGGVIITMGSTMIDLSLTNQLNIFSNNSKKTLANI